MATESGSVVARGQGLASARTTEGNEEMFRGDENVLQHVLLSELREMYATKSLILTCKFSSIKLIKPFL